MSTTMLRWTIPCLLLACGDSTAGTAGATTTNTDPSAATTGGTTTAPTTDAPTGTAGDTGVASSPTNVDPSTTTSGPSDPTFTTDPSDPSFTTDPSDPSDPSNPSDPTDPPATCDQSPNCIGPDSCAACSLGDTCGDELVTCTNTPDDECNKYSNCVSGCNNDPGCINACYVAFPAGYEPSWALFDCAVCDTCPTACASGQAYCANGGGGPGKPGEACDDIGDCSLCNSCSVGKDCATEVADCMADPECLPYQSCASACPQNDAACLDACEEMYPDGYATAWAQFDCAQCNACPNSCSIYADYCAGGGGGPSGGDGGGEEEGGPRCADNDDCAAIYGPAYPYCVAGECVECLGDQNCGDPNAPVCVDGYCG